MEGIDPQLVQAVRDGSYVVDAHAVADAILRRRRKRLATVLEALECDAPPVCGEEDDAAAGPDPA